MPDTTLTREVSVEEGYTYWSAEYDQDDNALIVLEEQLAIPLLASITAGHSRDDYLRALSDARFRAQTVQEALVRAAPAGAFSEDLLARDGDKPFCLVILAAKPGANA